ncbi:sterol desaturase family protein [Algoriphagus boritolerans]|uniref:Sterol desaturase/sphingolipid hydroxylase, fatty acid hydroxylase superfamily n=1 Tax=Algoriphagus boritolerans DSM 17298 = JCM 18970 TaxID=1120964 RepID=A0A1H5S6Z9_9BACT|nr:sterol desaturase family protein [Algoriphagus boritolerans]SEF45688.1 Sterol desaturase/sphingolipid hydroxylase, fatty acid hydroxylase superfamily [Algoriphagus boritolerans DSM 17298 = JCM 18970]
MEFNLDWLLKTDYTTPSNFLILTGILLVGIFLRYLALAWIYHELVYKKLGDFRPYRRLHQQVKLGQVRREIWYSFLGAIIFALAGTAMLICWQRGYTQLYTSLSVLDILWIPLAFIAALFIHETYYYWLHRWMHHPKVLHRFHHIHHTSLYTSSFTSFSFHPVEAGFQAIFLPVLVLLLPMHFFVLIGLLITMSVTAVINHSGVEVYPSSAVKSPMTKWIIGATHHDMHHLKYRCNYGLYFTFWDQWMGTEESGFEDRFLKHSVKEKSIPDKFTS